MPWQDLTTAWPATSLWKRPWWSLTACRPRDIPKLADSWPYFAPQEPKKYTVAYCERPAEQDQIREYPSCNTACYRIPALSIDFDGVFLQALDDNQYWLCPPVYHFIGAVGQKAQHLAGKAIFSCSLLGHKHGVIARNKTRSAPIPHPVPVATAHLHGTFTRHITLPSRLTSGHLQFRGDDLRTRSTGQLLLPAGLFQPGAPLRDRHSFQSDLQFLECDAGTYRENGS